MDRTKIEGSSNIAEVGYDYDSRTMEVLFHNGNVYQYWPITPSGWDSFLKSDSKGSFFAKHIRDNKGVSYRRLDDLQASK